eukprot:5008-Prorocentrum_minimum.AAC.2
MEKSLRLMPKSPSLVTKSPRLMEKSPRLVPKSPPLVAKSPPLVAKAPPPRLAAKLYPEYLPRLPDEDWRPKYSTCAVVGNSGTLLGKGYGAEIDTHDAVCAHSGARLSLRDYSNTGACTKWTDSQTDRQPERQTARQTDRQMDGWRMNVMSAIDVTDAVDVIDGRDMDGQIDVTGDIRQT